VPAPPLATPLRVAVGVALLLLVGLLAVAAARELPPASAGSGRRFRLRHAGEVLALAWAAGLAVAVPLLMGAGLAGLPLRGRPIALLLAAVAAATGAVAALAARHRGRLAWAHRQGADSPRPAVADAGAIAAAVPSASAGRDAVAAAPAVLLWAGRLALAAAVLLAVVKLALVPLWSWDHYAIWGLKARLLAAEGRLDPQALDRFDLIDTVPDYPLGVPLAWLAATLGGLPGEAVVRGFHVAWLLALVVLVHAAARRLSGSPLVALAAAAVVAASPLAWDSIHLGLADLPLALFAVAAVAAAAAALDGVPGEAEPSPARPPAASAPGAGPGGWALAGLFLGFLPWVKSEGASLAALLALALVAWRWQAGRQRWARDRARDWARDWARDAAALVLPAALIGGAAVALGNFLLPPGRSFFGGDPMSRLARRSAAPWDEVLAPVAAELAGRQWLGLWAALLVVLAVAIVRRRVAALALAAVVVLQLAVYVAVFFVTHLPAADHVESALHRIAAALVPLVALAAAALAAGRPASTGSAGTGSAGTRSAGTLSATKIPT
jgi:hypothetical protein